MTHPKLLLRRNLPSYPAVRFLAGKYHVDVKAGPPPDVSCFRDIYVNDTNGCAVDTVDRVLYSGSPDKANLSVGEWVHELCHLVGHPPWEVPDNSDEFVVIWSLENALIADLVRRGYYSEVDLLHYHNEHFTKYYTAQGVAAGSYRVQALHTAIRRSKEIAYLVGLLTKTGRPTYRQATWDPFLEDKWNEYLSFSELSHINPSRDKPMKPKVWEEIPADVASRLATKRGLNLRLLKESSIKNGRPFSAKISKVPGDEDFVDFCARDNSGETTYWLHGMSIDINFVKGSV